MKLNRLALTRPMAGTPVGRSGARQFSASWYVHPATLPRMAAVTFDTLKFVETLQAAGVSEPQAKAIASAVRDAHDAADVPAKGDLRELRTDLRELESRLKAEISRNQAELIKWVAGSAFASVGVFLALSRMIH
jgi:hypothetical protein